MAWTGALLRSWHSSRTSSCTPARPGCVRGICVGSEKLALLLGRYGKAGCRLLQQLLSEGRKLDCYAARDFAARGELQLVQAVAAAAASGEAEERVREHAAVYVARLGHMQIVRWAVG